MAVLGLVALVLPGLSVAWICTQVLRRASRGGWRATEGRPRRYCFVGDAFSERDT